MDKKIAIVTILTLFTGVAIGSNIAPLVFVPFTNAVGHIKARPLSNIIIKGIEKTKSEKIIMLPDNNVFRYRI